MSLSRYQRCVPYIDFEEWGKFFLCVFLVMLYMSSFINEMLNGRDIHLLSLLMPGSMILMLIGYICYHTFDSIDYPGSIFGFIFCIEIFFGVYLIANELFFLFKWDSGIWGFLVWGFLRIIFTMFMIFIFYFYVALWNDIKATKINMN
jgi:hypothetical protein